MHDTTHDSTMARTIRVRRMLTAARTRRAREKNPKESFLSLLRSTPQNAIFLPTNQTNVLVTQSTAAKESTP